MHFTVMIPGKKSLTASELIMLAHKIDLSSITPQESMIKAGDVIQLRGETITIPHWLKTPLPRRVYLHVNESLVDLTLPLESNPFHGSMLMHMENSGMLKSLQSGTEWRYKEHVLMIGSSGG
jgi:hypothetical protein